MLQTKLPIQQFDVKQVSFYVLGSEQPFQGLFAPVYQIISFLTGRPKMDLTLVALTNQETAGNLMEIAQMEHYGNKYLRQAVQSAWKEGFLVTKARWDGIIHPNNLSIIKSAPRCKIWEFPPENSSYSSTN